MNLSKFSLLVFTLFLIFISHYPLQTLGESLYESLCNEVNEDKARCLEILKQDPQIVGAKDNNELSKFILEFAQKRGIEALNLLKEEVKKNPSTSSKECEIAFYDEAVKALKSSFKNSLLELGEEAVASSNDAKVSRDGPSNCDKALKEMEVTNPSLIAFDKDMSLLVELATISMKKAH